MRPRPDLSSTGARFGGWKTASVTCGTVNEKTEPPPYYLRRGGREHGSRGARHEPKGLPPAGGTNLLPARSRGPGGAYGGPAGGRLIGPVPFPRHPDQAERGPVRRRLRRLLRRGGFFIGDDLRKLQQVKRNADAAMRRQEPTRRKSREAGV